MPANGKTFKSVHEIREAFIVSSDACDALDAEDQRVERTRKAKESIGKLLESTIKDHLSGRRQRKE